MRATAWTVPADILDGWIGEEKPKADTAAISIWIARAEREIRREFPTLQKRIDSGDEPDLEETIKDVTSAMVTRVLRNPHGYRQVARTDGPFTASSTYGGETPGELRMTTQEYDALEPPREETRSQRPFTIHPGLSPMYGSA